MASFPSNGNKEHEELRKGEVFIGNLETKAFNQLRFSTKRRGEQCFTKGGAPLSILDTCPVFVLRSEIETHEDGKGLIMKLLKHGLW